MATSRKQEDVRVLVGRNLKRAREEAGLTQAELARAANVEDAQYVSKWERGIYLVSTDSLLALAEVLKHDLSWFYMTHDEPTEVAA